MPPLGLLTLAAMLPDSWEPRLINENVNPVTEEDLQWCDVVFISAMIVQSKRIRELTKLCREAGKTVVAGGPYPTQFYEQIEGVDHFVLGEAESGVLNNFITDWEAGKAKKAYVTQVIRQKENERAMDMQEFERLQRFFGSDSVVKREDHPPSLKKSPIPRYDLLDVKAYGSMALQLSRGCPFSCEFCSEPALFGHKPRLKSGEQIIRELDTIYNLGYRGSVFFVDDNFIGNIKEVQGVLDMIADYQEQREFPFSFYTEASLNLAANPELMKRMQKAGFNMVFVGLETTDAATLESANKSQNTGRDLLADVKEIQNYGMEVTAGFIVGMDREPDDICDQIYAFCQDAGIPTVMVGLLEPLRGSPLFSRLSSEGRLLSEPLGGNNTHSFRMNFVPDQGRDPEKILRGYKDLLGRLFPANGKAYFKRVERLLENMEITNAAKRAIGRDEIGALMKSIFHQSFSPYAPAYIKLLLKTLFKYPSKFSEAVRLSITGHHFIRITNDALRADAIKEEIGQKTSQTRLFLTKLQKSGNSVNEQVSAFVRTQNKKLRKLQRKISSFPAEHRNELLDAYRELLLNITELQRKIELLYN